MRLTVLMQYAKGLQTSDPETGSKVSAFLESSKRYLWHGNVVTALEHINGCSIYCDVPDLNYTNLKSLQTYLDKMYTYIRKNKMMIQTTVKCTGTESRFQRRLWNQRSMK